MSILSDIKALLAAAAVAVFMAGGWYSCARVGERRVAERDVVIAQRDAALVEFEKEDRKKDDRIAELVKLNHINEETITTMQREAADRQRELDRLPAIWRQRGKDEALAALERPVTGDCEAMLREACRRAQAVWRAHR